MNESVGVSPVVTLLAFIGFRALIGPAGALLAIPLAATLQAALRALVQTERNEAGRTRAVEVYELEQRLDHIAAAAEDSPEALRIAALVERARSLLARAQEAA